MFPPPNICLYPQFQILRNYPNALAFLNSIKSFHRGTLCSENLTLFFKLRYHLIQLAGLPLKPQETTFIKNLFI